MKKILKTYLLPLLILLPLMMLTVVVLSSCSSTPEQVPYSFTNEQAESNNWRIEAPADQTVTFDGKIEEGEYPGEKLIFSDPNGVTLTLQSKMADAGVFFGFSSNDKQVFYNNEYPIYQNTGVEIQLAVGGTEELNASVLQLRYGVNGAIEEWIGLPSSSSYDYIRKYSDTTSKVTIHGELNGACDGYEIEVYVPYSSLNLTEKPDSLVCAPSFNTRKSFTANGRSTWAIMVGSSYNEPSSWYRITPDGQSVTTGGFAQNGNKLTQTGNGNQYYYFDDTFSDCYYLSADVTVESILNGDQFPKFGIVNRTKDQLFAYYLDIAGKKLNNVGKVQAKNTEFLATEWLWDTYASHTFDTEDVHANLQAVRLEVVRCGDYIWFLVNGTPLMGDVQLTEDSVAGLFFFNTEATIKVNEYSADEARVRDIVASSGLAPEITLDADLNDWDTLGTLLKNETDYSTGNKMAVFAKAGSNGLYIAYDITHAYNPRIYSWDNVWYFNTNAEFWLNNKHFAATATGNTGFMLSSMKTTEQLDGKYRTIVEIFVPKAVFGDMNVYTLGVAFKTCDQKYDKIEEVTNPLMKFKGDPWWFFDGHFPSNPDEQFTID